MADAMADVTIRQSYTVIRKVAAVCSYLFCVKRRVSNLFVLQVTKVKQQKKTLSNKEKKKKQRLRAAKIKAGEPVSSDSDEDY